MLKRQLFGRCDVGAQGLASNEPLKLLSWVRAPEAVLIPGALEHSKLPAAPVAS